MTIFDTPGPYLINDRYKTDPTGRFLDFLIKKREEGAPVVGRYCGYAPLELIRAVGAVPVSLCASSQWSVPAAEAVLPANLCPLIKSSFGFIRTDSCPLFALSEAVIGETTCDRKKKMFALISHLKPTHVMDLPNMPKGFGVGDQWLATVRKLKEFLETTFQKRITAERLEEEIWETNRKNSLIDGFFDCLTRHPPPVCWQEIYDVIGLDPISTGEELQTLMTGIAARLEERVEAGIGFGAPSSPRVLVTGCPIDGDALKVLKITEEAGGVVVALEACSGMKGYAIPVAEGTGDPLRAIAEATLRSPARVCLRTGDAWICLTG
jgi:benzoyl-CoA reductase/2-hydroxyglutaryl-CoA dehydratase subunit BcrC/BadD/HgdB